MRRHRHNCGDAKCPKFGRQTCALCDDAGPPKGSARIACAECGRTRARRPQPGEFDAQSPCACGGWYAVAVGGGSVAHSVPSCDDFARLSGGAFVEMQRMRRRAN